MQNNFHSGFVAILGRPNVGKSTFLNRVVGQKIAIMSDKAQTTRNKIQGIYTEDNAQIVFIDTPGIHKPHQRYIRYPYPINHAQFSIYFEILIFHFQFSLIFFHKI